MVVGSGPVGVRWSSFNLQHIPMTAFFDVPSSAAIFAVVIP